MRDGQQRRLAQRWVSQTNVCDTGGGAFRSDGLLSGVAALPVPSVGAVELRRLRRRVTRDLLRVLERPPVRPGLPRIRCRSSPQTESRIAWRLRCTFGRATVAQEVGPPFRRAYGRTWSVVRPGRWRGRRRRFRGGWKVSRLDPAGGHGRGALKGRDAAGAARAPEGRAELVDGGGMRAALATRFPGRPRHRVEGLSGVPPVSRVALGRSTFGRQTLPTCPGGRVVNRCGGG